MTVAREDERAVARHFKGRPAGYTLTRQQQGQPLKLEIFRWRTVLVKILKISHSVPGPTVRYRCVPNILDTNTSHTEKQNR